MLKKILSLFVFIAVATVAVSSMASTEVVEESADQTPSIVTTLPPPDMPVKAYVVFDIEANEFLYTYNAEQSLPIASITKLFAASAAHDTFDLEQVVTLEWADLSSVGTAGQLQYGQSYTYRELLFPLLLSSSNNAALAFERRINGDVTLPSQTESLFQEMIGLSLQFADASGLSSGNLATAQEIALAANAVRTSYPYIWNITQLNQYVGPYHGWKNNSPFIVDDSYRGGKHGYTTAAGRTAVAVFAEDIDGEEREFLYVLLGSTDLVQDMSKLRQYTLDSVVWR